MERDQVAALLAGAGGYLSGEEMSRTLGVTRAAVWKEIDALRRRVAELVRCIDDDITIHDFRMVSGPTHTNVIFDAVVPYDFRLSDREVEEKIQNAVQVLDSGFQAKVRVERSYT